MSLPSEFARFHPFLRALLLTDGPVTKLLEAYYLEPIEVKRLTQKEIALEADVPWLEAKKGDRLTHREVLLHGKTSGRIYVFARSLIRLDLLEPGIQEGLQSDGIGIGDLIQNERWETYREVLDFGQVEACGLAALFGLKECDRLLIRHYRILSKDRPVILIEERFPETVFPKPE